MPAIVRRQENRDLVRAARQAGLVVAPWVLRELGRVARERGPAAVRQVAQALARRTTNRVLPRRFGYTGPEETISGAIIQGQKKDTQMSEKAAAGYAQRVDYYKKKGGKRVSKRQKVMSALTSHVQPIIERWQRQSDIVSADVATGKRGANALLAGKLDATEYIWPVYLFDVTGVKNPNIGYAATYPNVAWTLQQTDATNDFYYKTYTGTDDGDINDLNTWGVEKLSRQVASLANVPFAGMRSFIDRLNIKMTAFGCSKQPTEVYLEMWRFTDEKLVPKQICTVGGASIDPEIEVENTIDQDRMNGFWQYMLGKMVGTSNSHHVDYEQGKGVDIKRLWTFKFGPSSADNEGVGQSYKNLTYDHQFNRYLKLDWDTGEGQDIAETDIGNPDVYAQVGTQNAVHAFPNQKSRVFLVVRADVQQTFVGPFTTILETARNTILDEFMPQFDICIRRFRHLVHT